MDSQFSGSDFHFNASSYLKGSQVLWLNDPETVWVLQSGAIAIFACPLQEGQPMGARRYLFSCEPGAILIGSLSKLEPQSWGLLAVPLEASELLPMSCDNLQKLMEKGDVAAIASLEDWLQKLQTAISPHTLPAITTSLQDLPQLYAEFFEHLEQLEVQEQADAWSRFEARQRFDNQIATDAMADLAALLQPQRRGVQAASPTWESAQLEGEPEDWALYQATQAVGQALGIPIRLPAKSENLRRAKDPLAAIARASQIRIRRVLLTDQWWRRDCGPLLAYTREDNQPVALIPISAARYELFDPVQGTRMPVDARVRSHLSPIAYMFYRALPDRATHILDVLRFGLRDSLRDWQTILWTGTAATLIGMLIPIATAVLIDQAIPEANRGLLLQIGVGLLAATLGGVSFQLTQGFALMRVETNVEASTQPALWNRLLALGVPFFRQYSTGDLRSRISVISTIRRQISGATLRTLFSGLFALLNLGLLLYYSGRLALIAAIAALVIVSTTAIAGFLTLRQVVPLQELEGSLFGLIVQLVSGVAKLRVAGAEERAFAYWAKQYSQQQKLKLRMQRIEDSLSVLNQVLPVLSSAALFGVAVGIIQATAREATLSIGAFLAFNVAFGSFIAGTTGLSNTVLELLATLALGQRTQPILTAQPEVDDDKTDPGQLSGRLALEHVTFRYRQEGPIVLDDVSLQANPGEFVAIVGSSGSGKSTLFRLLLGFETPQAGQVYYDGQDLRGLNVQAVRRQLGVLLQTSRTNTASIFENIAGNALISMDEAWEAARYAGLEDDIAAMPMGMHTFISEGGSNLSGGQRQRLLIARALALKPRILLFDEATSFLDNRTQAIVSESLERLQVTRIVIAHRLSTIRNADRIYVMEAGQIVQQGQFEQLIHQEGLFAKLMQRQMA